MNSGVPHRRVKIIWNIKDIVTQAVRAWVEHGTSTMGAALAFYTVFSVARIFPGTWPPRESTKRSRSSRDSVPTM
jgi:hypothetical protein